MGPILDQLRQGGVEVAETIRIADHDVKPGVTSDEGAGDAWPALREQILAADLLVFGTPIWLGHASSIAQKVQERMDAFLGEGDDSGRLPTYGKVAIVAVVGNEDGAHKVCADVFQGLNDVGFSLAPNAGVYWVGEAMGSVDLKDLPTVPEKAASAAANAAKTALHLVEALSAAKGEWL